MKRLFFVCAFCTICASMSCFSQWLINSPSGNIRFSLQLNKARLSYNVFAVSNGKIAEIIEQSSLGVLRQDQAFDSLFFISKNAQTKTNETYFLASGKRLKNLNHFNSIVFHFKNKQKQPIDLSVRVYNDGVAFRYSFPNHDTKNYQVIREATSFNLPQGNAWMTIYGDAEEYSPAYENLYEATTIGASTKKASGWSFPALFEVNKHWALITEANVGSNFYGSHLDQYAPDGSYTVVPPLEDEIGGVGDSKGTSTLPWEMPWRVIVIGKSPAAIVESNLVYHVSNPSLIKNSSWVKPGRASWAWWSGFLDKSVDSLEKLQHFIDFAQRMNWEYSLVDANWHNRPGVSIENLANYAAKRNVDLLLWYNSAGPHNKITEGPRNLMFDRDVRRAEMKKIAGLGIKGIKVDFFVSDKQVMMKLYHDILSDALEYKLLVNFHGCTLPKGWSRTYPNLISHEAIRGAENYAFNVDFHKTAPAHNAILPFSRNVVGPMDYTPIIFSNVNEPHYTSYGHELALSVVFESAVVHFPDIPEKYESLNSAAIDFLRKVPAAWDDIKFITGYPGKHIVLARRKGNDWYLGGINADSFSKKIQFNFSFLDKSGKYKASIITDGKEKNSLQATDRVVNAVAEFETELSAFGGFVIKLSKLEVGYNNFIAESFRVKDCFLFYPKRCRPLP